MKVLIVGHGPSILQGLGESIDSFGGKVVRCKRTLPADSSTKNYGTRTDYLVGRSHLWTEIPRFWIYQQGGIPGWMSLWKQFGGKAEFSVGLAAALLAVDKLKPKELWTIGCDRLMGRFYTGKSWEVGTADVNKRINETLTCHDWLAEHRMLHALGIPVKELTRGVACLNSSNMTP